MENPKFQIFMGKDEQLYFRLRAGNGEIILGSEGYKVKASCEKGIAAVKEHAPDDANFRRKTATNGEFYFVLVAQNHETVGTSETYTSEQAREKGIAAVKDDAPGARTEDTTKPE